VAIRRWLRRHYPSLPVIELHKDECADLLPALKALVRPDDLILLHSGGNLGDRGIWSESRRRLMITAFPNNKIVSLPQTIYFSDTPKGRAERENSRRIYAAHGNLTVIGRDPESGRIAAELFPRAQTFCMPDFVLSLPPKPVRSANQPPRVLLCLRLDDETALTEAEKTALGESLPYECSYFDTTLQADIPAAKREEILNETLSLFERSDAVVTDRYHGLIFAVLCRKPVVVLPTVNHKLSSAVTWFEDVPFVRFASNTGRVNEELESVLQIGTQHDELPKWNERYFDVLPATLCVQ
jgi:pyruvyl transferase EpsI